MPRFKDIRFRFNKTIEEERQAEKSLKSLQYKLKSLQRKRREWMRKGKRAKNYVERLKSIDEQMYALDGQIKIDKAKIIDIQKIIDQLFKELEKYTDPRENLSRLDDRNPIMLFPVRIETRFKKVDIDGNEKDQLWVRVYPDDIAIDTFEEVLSEEEVESAQIYWHNTWQAAGDEDLERAAWKNLVNSYGSGRAQYIIGQYQPNNPNEKPNQLQEHQYYLTIGTKGELNTSDKDIIASFWKKMWMAFNKREKQIDAYDHLKNNLPGTDGEKEVRIKEIFKKYKPVNFYFRPDENGDNLEVSVIFINFPQADNLKQDSWSKAPETFILPERFVITGYNKIANEKNIAFQQVGNHIPDKLKVGPDPSLSEGEQLKQLEDGDLRINQELQWLYDFDEAVSKGMGFKIDLTTEQAEDGFDKIVVLGVKLNNTPEKNIKTLETLFEHHNYSTSGLAILQQGTPSNNTEDVDSFYTEFDNPNTSFDYRNGENQYALDEDWRQKKDGQWLAEWLGLNPDLFQKTAGAGQTDQLEARAMNTLLFPATMGYTMGSLMADVFSQQTMEATRFYFKNYVSARGVIPAIRVGNQPYGILPTTNFQESHQYDIKTMTGLRLTRMPWDDSTGVLLSHLFSILKTIDRDWDFLVSNVSYIGKKTSEDPDQLLLDVLGLTPNSVEHYQRYAQSLVSIKNQVRLLGWAGIPELWDALNDRAKNLLKELGYHGEANPDILKKVFLKGHNKLASKLIDDVPLSETKEIRPYTTRGKNYLEWLIDAAKTSHDTLRKQKGFEDEKHPNTLLYLMAHHALDLEYIDSGLRLLQKKQIISEAEFAQFKKEPDFIHIKPDQTETESRWRYLYKKYQEIPEAKNRLLGTAIPKLLTTELSDSYFKEQLEALEQLKNIPTARLERLLVEHIDLCSYRLDAWKQSFMTFLLTQMRFEKDSIQVFYTEGEEEVQDTTYIGAYGYLENVRSKNKVLNSTNLDNPDLENLFNTDGKLKSDKQNKGYITAPSLSQAVTAAILRNAYLLDNNPETYEINLSSVRVRKALSIIEGIRGGQNLSALLGYYFERELHDQNTTLTQIDYHIHQLRKAFPLNSNKLKSTQTEESIPIEAIEARNVLDGLALINQIKKSGHKEYPFGMAILDNISLDLQKAINKEADNIMNLADAVADMAIAEGIHQTVLGNYERSGAVMDTYSKGNFPPVPDVIQTPRSGTGITQRFGLQLKTEVPEGYTPRSKAEPAINDWLGTVLPGADEVAVWVEIRQFDGTIDEKIVSQKDLELQPIDLLYGVNTEDDQIMKDLDDKIERYIQKENTLRPDDEVRIRYTKRVDGKTTLFQLNALLKSLRTLILESRPLEPTDLMSSNDLEGDKNPSYYLNDARLKTVIGDLSSISTKLDVFLNDLTPLVQDVDAHRDQFFDLFDEKTNDFTSILGELSNYGWTESSTGFLFEKKQALYRILISKLKEVTVSWKEQLETFDEKMQDYENLPSEVSDEDKMKLLHQMEYAILTSSLADIGEHLDDSIIILREKRADLGAAKNRLEHIIDNPPKSVSRLFAKIKAEEPSIIPFYFGGFSILDQEEAMIQFVTEFHDRGQSLKKRIKNKIDKAAKLIKEANDLMESKAQVELIQNAGKILFGEEFKMIPEFEMPEQSAEMWLNSYEDRDQLLNYLENDLKRDFPVDEWIYSLARVREKVKHWENVVHLSEAFGKDAPELKPVQLPYLPNDSWLAFDYPEDYKIEEDKLLYTAFYTEDFEPNKRQCGLLLDEWTELIPSKNEDIGIGFHYDKPNSEPPQVILMALPTRFKKAWEWNDLLDIIHDTMNQAQKRAIEPDHINEFTYGRFLPVTVASTNVIPLTATLNYAAVNGIFSQSNSEENG